MDVANTRLSVHPIKMKDRLRDDKPEDCLTQDEALENAKRKKDGFFKGPKAV
ncbi:MAG: aspartyl/glutamyl-tRNA amidotransferase subunit C [Candidatus Nanoarchaeia archaeon]